MGGALCDVCLNGQGQPRRRDVDRLFGEWTVQRIGFVEQSQDPKLSIGEEPFQRHLTSRDEIFNQEETA